MGLFILPAIATVRGARKAFKEHRLLENNPGHVAFAEIRESEIYYTKGKDAYTVSIPFKEILGVSYRRYIWFTLVKLRLSENRALPIWNLINSKELYESINKKI